MDHKIGRRAFIQKTSGAAVGLAGAIVLIQPAKRQKEAADRSTEENIERWLLHTGRHSLDTDTYLNAARQL